MDTVHQIVSHPEQAVPKQTLSKQSVVLLSAGVLVVTVAACVRFSSPKRELIRPDRAAVETLLQGAGVERPFRLDRMTEVKDGIDLRCIQSLGRSVFMFSIQIRHENGRWFVAEKKLTREVWL